MRTLTLAETKSHLSAVVDQVIAGEEIVITRRGRPVARIIAEPVQPAADAAAIAAELRAFVLSQTPQARTAAEVVLRTVSLTNGDASELGLADITLILAALQDVGADDAARLLALEATGYWKQAP